MLDISSGKRDACQVFDTSDAKAYLRNRTAQILDHSASLKKDSEGPLGRQPSRNRYPLRSDDRRTWLPAPGHGKVELWRPWWLNQTLVKGRRQQQDKAKRPRDAIYFCDQKTNRIQPAGDTPVAC